MRMRKLVGVNLLELHKGDITLEETEAIANAANSALAGGGGVDGAIHAAGGPSLMAELKERYRGCPTGEAVITAGGNLHARFVLHAVGPRYSGKPGDAQLLASAYRSCLALCVEHRIHSVSFPSISTGIYGYPVPEAAPVALGAVIEHLKKETFPELARFVLFDEATYQAYARILNGMVF